MKAKRITRSRASRSVAFSTTKKAHGLQLHTTGRWRYVSSLVLFVVTASVLTIGSVGGVMQDASAREGYFTRYNSWQRSQERRTTPQQESARREVPQQTRVNNTTPAQTTPDEPVAPVEQTTQPTPAPVRVAPVQQSTAVAPVPVDTAPDIAVMTAAQAQDPTLPVTYSSQMISESTRDRLLLLAGVGVLSSLVMLILTVVGGGFGGRSLAPQRYRIPVREVVSQ